MALANVKPVESREFALQDAEFQAIADAIYAQAGIVVGANKRDLVYSRLARRLRSLGLPDFAAYVRRLDGPEGQAEIGFLINALTTNHTHFFRESHHFDFMLDTAIPYWIKRAERGGSRCLRIWSAGCSSGEEPYSIATTMADGFRGRVGWDWKILATDIDTDVLNMARAGRYGMNRLKDVPESAQKKYLDKIAGKPDERQFKPELRKHITFNRLNLHGKWPMRCKFDLIFCRNVAIYFDAEAKKTLVQRFTGTLRDDGWICLGHSETGLGESANLDGVGRTIYKKRGGAGA